MCEWERVCERQGAWETVRVCVRESERETERERQRERERERVHIWTDIDMALYLRTLYVYVLPLIKWIINVNDFMQMERFETDVT